MDSFVEDIRDFHEKFRLEYDGPPRELPFKLFMFRAKFLGEELDEYNLAVGSGDLAKQLDSLVDLVYVAIGTAYLHGFNFNEAWRRVHEANMNKVRAMRVEESVRGSAEYDVVKPPGWSPPSLEDLV